MAACQLPVCPLSGPGQRAAPRRRHRPAGRRDRGGGPGIGRRRGSDLRPGRPSGGLRRGLARPVRRAGARRAGRRPDRGRQVPVGGGRSRRRDPAGLVAPLPDRPGAPQRVPVGRADPRRGRPARGALRAGGRAGRGQEPRLRAGDQLRPPVRRARRASRGQPGLHEAADRPAHRQPLPRPGPDGPAAALPAHRRRRRRRLDLHRRLPHRRGAAEAGPSGVHLPHHHAGDLRLRGRGRRAPCHRPDDRPRPARADTPDPLQRPVPRPGAAARGAGPGVLRRLPRLRRAGRRPRRDGDGEAGPRRLCHLRQHPDPARPDRLRRRRGQRRRRYRPPASAGLLRRPGRARIGGGRPGPRPGGPGRPGGPSGAGRAGRAGRS